MDDEHFHPAEILTYSAGALPVAIKFEKKCLQNTCLQASCFPVNSVLGMTLDTNTVKANNNDTFTVKQNVSSTNYNDVRVKDRLGSTKSASFLAIIGRLAARFVNFIKRILCMRSVEQSNERNDQQSAGSNSRAETDSANQREKSAAPEANAFPAHENVDFVAENVNFVQENADKVANDEALQVLQEDIFAPLQEEEIREEIQPPNPALPEEPATTLAADIHSGTHTEPQQPRLYIHSEEVHNQRMNGPVEKVNGENDINLDPLSPEDYRGHINSALMNEEGSFLLGNEFFVRSEMPDWRARVKTTFPVAESDTSNPAKVITNRFSRTYITLSPEESAIYRAMSSLWPNSGDVPFCDFVFTPSRIDPQRRYDLISSHERMLLKNIVLAVKDLREELELLKKKSSPTGKERARMQKLEVGIGAIHATVNGHEGTCHVRLSAILTTCKSFADAMMCESGDVNTTNGVVKQILSKFRTGICEYAFGQAGEFFGKTHTIDFGNGKDFNVNFKGPKFNGQIAEAHEAIFLMVAPALGLDAPEKAPVDPHQGIISYIKFKDFVMPFVDRVKISAANEELSVASVAEDEFESLNAEVLQKFEKEFLQCHVSFEDYCNILGKNVASEAAAFRRKLEEFAHSEDFDGGGGGQNARDLLLKWCSAQEGPQMMTLTEIRSALEDLDCGFCEMGSELIPQLFGKDVDKPKNMASLHFPAYLLSTGALIRKREGAELLGKDVDKPKNMASLHFQAHLLSTGALIRKREGAELRS
ncbi:MAG: hypothetical protein LBT64_01175 [Puniceicoccales bacterium]|jgi:hypothetical protein|nr:hypothetical protein [Puniceicoccales bacterium]